MDKEKEIYELACILYQNKEYNLLWHDCIYLAGQIVKGRPNIDKKNIKTTDWLTRGMTKEQIEREKQEAVMAADLELLSEDSLSFDELAKKMLDEGYRKQIEGEWITVGEELKDTTCSVCGYWVETPYGKTPYCPNCGAKMVSTKQIFNEGGYESLALSGGMN